MQSNHLLTFGWVSNFSVSEQILEVPNLTGSKSELQCSNVRLKAQHMTYEFDNTDLELKIE